MPYVVGCTVQVEKPPFTSLNKEQFIYIYSFHFFQIFYCLKTPYNAFEHIYSPLNTPITTLSAFPLRDFFFPPFSIQSSLCFPVSLGSGEAQCLSSLPGVGCYTYIFVGSLREMTTQTHFAASRKSKFKPAETVLRHSETQL